MCRCIHYYKVLTFWMTDSPMSLLLYWNVSHRVSICDITGNYFLHSMVVGFMVGNCFIPACTHIHHHPLMGNWHIGQDRVKIHCYCITASGSYWKYVGHLTIIQIMLFVVSFDVCSMLPIINCGLHAINTMWGLLTLLGGKVNHITALLCK